MLFITTIEHPSFGKIGIILAHTSLYASLKAGDISHWSWLASISP
jgi:hypothetical protein